MKANSKRIISHPMMMGKILLVVMTITIVYESIWLVFSLLLSLIFALLHVPSNISSQVSGFVALNGNVALAQQFLGNTLVEATIWLTNRQRLSGSMGTIIFAFLATITPFVLSPILDHPNADQYIMAIGLFFIGILVTKQIMVRYSSEAQSILWFSDEVIDQHLSFMKYQLILVRMLARLCFSPYSWDRILPSKEVRTLCVGELHGGSFQNNALINFLRPIKVTAILITLLQLFLLIVIGRSPANVLPTAVMLISATIAFYSVFNLVVSPFAALLGSQVVALLVSAHYLLFGLPSSNKWIYSDSYIGLGLLPTIILGVIIGIYSQHLELLLNVREDNSTRPFFWLHKRDLQSIGKISLWFIILLLLAMITTYIGVGEVAYVFSYVSTNHLQDNIKNDDVIFKISNIFKLALGILINTTIAIGIPLWLRLSNKWANDSQKLLGISLSLAAQTAVAASALTLGAIAASLYYNQYVSLLDDCYQGFFIGLYPAITFSIAYNLSRFFGLSQYGILIGGLFTSIGLPCISLLVYIIGVIISAPSLKDALNSLNSNFNSLVLSCTLLAFGFIIGFNLSPWNIIPRIVKKISSTKRQSNANSC